jgi:hypothetical protein
MGAEELGADHFEQVHALRGEDELLHLGHDRHAAGAGEALRGREHPAVLGLFVVRTCRES